MILSILIPSIPSRRNQLVALLAELYKQQSSLNTTHPTLGSVEILVDDSISFREGGLSIGGKRDLLLKRASGKYLCFLDDDDNVTPNYLETIVRLAQGNPDIITFRTLIKNDHYWAIIDMDLDNRRNDEVNPNGLIRRTPWHICPVRADIAKSEPFSVDLNHNEDWDWMGRVLMKVATDAHTNMILTQYNHSEAGSEADAIERVGKPVEYRTALISLAINGRESYTEKSKALQSSIADHWPYDVRLYRAYPSYCTPHEIIPYKFKYDLIAQARKDGYNRVVWLDSSIRMLQDSCALFGEQGVFAFDNLGHPLYKYISDRAAENLQVTDAMINKIPQTWGGAIGFDFTRDAACAIFAEIIQQATMGSFENGGSVREGFVSHRHDQAINSVLLWKHGYKLLPYGIIAAKDDVTEKTYLQYGD
jgi:glycosyltransferase involved in cell wall biosynthesis